MCCSLEGCCIFPGATVFFASWILFLCSWVPDLGRSDTPSNPPHICSHKNLEKSKPTMEACWFNQDFYQLCCFTPPSVSGCFHSRCKGILGDGNEDFYVKCGISGGLEGKIKWVKGLDPTISCREFLFLSWVGCSEGLKEWSQIPSLQHAESGAGMILSWEQKIFVCSMSSMKNFILLCMRNGILSS